MREYLENKRNQGNQKFGGTLFTDKTVVVYIDQVLAGTLIPWRLIPSPFHIKVYNAHAFSKTKTIGSAQYEPR